MMSLARKTARGAALTILSSMGGRVVGAIGTLVLTRFLSRDTMGEVEVATVIVFTASWFSLFGFGQYVIVRGKGDEEAEVIWHCTVANLVLGGAVLGFIALFGHLFTPFASADHAAVYVPGMALSTAIKRIGSIPEKILLKQLRFRPLALAAALGEITFAVVTVGLAAAGLGGASIVIGNVVQSLLWSGIMIGAAGVRSWTTPTPLRWARFVDMARFGVPLALESIAHNAARYWDNLLMARFFKPATMASYKLAYNLADIPAVQVGEQIGQALLPSMALLPPERRPRALERSAALLSLLIFPMAVGLALIAHPFVAVVLNAEWQGVAPLLVVLAALAIFRPITWVLGTYLEAQAQTSRLMFLEFGKLVLLLGGIAMLAPYGIQVAAGAVGVAYGFNAIAGVLLVSREGPSAWRLFKAFAETTLACVVMAAAVLGVRAGCVSIGMTSPLFHLIVGVVVGAGSYIVAALIICRETARDFLTLLRDVVSRRRGGDE